LQQKPAQSLGIGITGQAGQVLEGIIVAKERGARQAVEAENDGIDQTKNYLRKGIVVANPKILQPQGKKMTKLQHSKEFLKEEDSAVVRQTLMITGDFDISW
jgi:hypothetical protein